MYVLHFKLPGQQWAAVMDAKRFWSKRLFDTADQACAFIRDAESLAPSDIRWQMLNAKPRV